MKAIELLEELKSIYSLMGLYDEHYKDKVKEIDEALTELGAVQIQTDNIETHIEMLLDPEELIRIGVDKQPHRDLSQRVMRIFAEYNNLQEKLEAVRELDPCVLAFAKTMQCKLDLNKHKECDVMNPDGQGRGWSHCKFSWLLGRLKGELSELEYAIHDLKDEESARELQKEAADVGNFAMMMHDIVEQALSQQTLDLMGGDK